MALAARLEMRQGQGLVITPQLQQAIKLLQLSNIELEAFVEAELEKNPLLQRDEPDAGPDEPAAPVPKTSTATPPPASATAARRPRNPRSAPTPTAAWTGHGPDAGAPS